MILFIVLALEAFHGVYAENLDCYSCTNIRNVSDCHQLSVCAADEYCFTEATGIGDQTRFSLGCRSKQACLASTTTTTTYSPLSIIGRSASDYIDCSQCCANNACNKQICTTGTHAMGPDDCKDDPSYNCAHTSSAFNICGDKQHAKLVCRNFCGLCNLRDGNWSSWGSWSGCDVTCGTGSKSRHRACDNPAPRDGGLPCQGSPIDTTHCVLRDLSNLILSKVIGGWTQWTSWGSCSSTCGLGLARRDRHCTNPNPGADGIQCPGDSRDDRACFLRACADGRWSSWSSWTTCSASCLGGISKRRRTCTNPAPSKFGHDCVGNDEEHRLCNTIPCQGNVYFNPVRLVNGSSGYEGRLEVYHNGIWGTVCDDGFGTSDAQVVCRMLNSPPWFNARAYSSAHYGQGSGPIHLDSVQCSGSESSIFNCSHEPWGTNDCSHSEDVGVSCSPGQLSTGHWSSWAGWTSCSVTCGTGLKSRSRTCSSSSLVCIGNNKDYTLCNTFNCPTSVRLVNGPSQYEGRLEVYHNGAWGTVCDDSFSNNSAKVVCRMLNFPLEYAKFYGSAHFGQGTGTIALDDVICTGSEASIFDCSHGSWNSHNCGHGEDVGVSCFPRLRVRLVGGSSSHRGRVEVSIDGSHWGTVCDDSFDNQDAKVVCRMLGYPYTNARYDTTVSSGSGEIFLDDVDCNGSEENLLYCKHRAWGQDNCSHSEDVGVICS